MQWVESHPDLLKYFKENWEKAPDFDCRICQGESGEGVSRFSPQFTKVVEKLKSLREFLKLHPDASLRSSAEFRWLEELDLRLEKGIDRFIFISKETWNSKSRGWQDYIPVDQSLGPFASDPLLSTLIHEINVNSTDPFFLPGDTHSSYSKSLQLWQCSWDDVSFTDEVNHSPTLQAQALGYQPFLGVVYVAMRLKGIDLGCISKSGNRIVNGLKP
jgi:hypothetical protein